MTLDDAVLPEAQRRLVVLGASNVTLHLRTILSAGFGAGPVEFMIAHGLGRSYGLRSRVAMRELPPLLACGLWPTLASRPPLPTWALVTDVGNDIFYGVDVPRIAAWVDECVGRLQDAGARLLVTLPPLCNLARLPEWRYRLIRTICHPNCRLSLAETAARGEELSDRLLDLTHRRGVPALYPRRDWYGFDPIHIRWQAGPLAWGEILRDWMPGSPQGAAIPLRCPTDVLRLPPDQRWMWGREQRHLQPSRKFPDGSRLWLY